MAAINEDGPASETGGMMYEKLFGFAPRIIICPVLILLLHLPALHAGATTSGKPLPEKLLGVWQVTGVFVKVGSGWPTGYEKNDPRLMGGILYVSLQRMIFQTDGGTEFCKNPKVSMQTMTAGQLIRETMGERPAKRTEPPEYPTTSDYDLPFDQNEQLTIMWVKDFGYCDQNLGTWMLEMPDGRLAVSWWNDAILLFSRASATSIPPPASFDCTKARAPVEKTICGSLELSLLDRAISVTYQGKTFFYRGRGWGARDKRFIDALKQYENEQKAWLKKRDACGPDPHCLKTLMDTRIEAMDAIEDPQYSYDSWAESKALARAHGVDGAQLQAAEAAPAAKPLPEKLLGIWQVTGALTDAGSHWYRDFVNNDPRLIGGVVLVSSQKIMAKAGGETVVCVNPKMTTQDITAGRLVKETMGRRQVEAAKDPTPRDYGFPFEPDASLVVMWVKHFDGYWQPLNANGTWLLAMPDGRLAMRWHYTAILLLSRAPAATRPADIAQPLASFDCTKARTPVEKTICGSLELSLLDSYVAEWYEGFLGSLTDKLSNQEEAEPEYYRDMMKHIKKEQRAWRKQREACGPDPQCLKNSMDARAKTLAEAFANYKSPASAGVARSMAAQTIKAAQAAEFLRPADLSRSGRPR